jgi:hypothetical protein
MRGICVNISVISVYQKKNLRSLQSADFNDPFIKSQATLGL